ncbi:MAG TPA: HPr kinase/phosphatase C-terminal domain-containing protein [Sphingomonadales bacterium]
MELVHATCIDYAGRGLLIRGPSGAGKSDLALRLIHEGARLVGDDYVWVGAEGGRLYAIAPDAIRGRMEVRGVGIVTVPARRATALHCAIDLVAADEVERMPEQITLRLDGIDLPAWRIAPFEASAAAKVAAIVMACKNAPL